MFVLCIAYVCVSVCCSSDLPWHVKIATPTVLSASAFRPGIFRLVSFVPDHVSAFCRNASPGASVLPPVCCGGKSALRWVQTSKGTCISVENQLRWVQDRAHCVG